MKTSTKYVCWICHEEHDDEVSAEACEAKGFALPRFKIGDEIEYRAYLGSDRGGPYYGNGKGIVLDILFPTPQYKGPLGHKYGVSYLVKITQRGLGSGRVYFDQANIEPLNTLNTVTVIWEGATSGMDCIIGQRNPNLDYPLGRVVTSWADYVAMVVGQNPQLADRLNALTDYFKTIGTVE